MKKMIFLVWFLCGPFFLGFVPSAYARESRAASIENKLNCLQNQMDSPPVMAWSDVCSVDQYPKLVRNQAIERALNVAHNPEADLSSLTPQVSHQLAVASHADFKSKASLSRSVSSSRMDSATPAPDDDIFGEPSYPVFELATEVFAYKYKEPGVMDLKGAMYGVSAELDHRFFKNQPVGQLKDIFTSGNFINRFRIEALYDFGLLDYDSVSTGSINDERNYIFEIRGLLGYDIPLESGFLATFYSGFGYRYLQDQSSGKISTTNNWGYDRESNYLYVPMGLDVKKKIADTWKLGFNFEYDIFLRGLQRSHLGDGAQFNSYYADYPVVENRQDVGLGLRGSVKLEKDTENFVFFIEPFVRFWSIDNSDTKTIYHNLLYKSWYEPKNETTEIGLKVGVKF